MKKLNKILRICLFTIMVAVTSFLMAQNMDSSSKTKDSVVATTTDSSNTSAAPGNNNTGDSVTHSGKWGWLGLLGLLGLTGLGKPRNQRV